MNPNTMIPQADNARKTNAPIPAHEVTDRKRPAVLSKEGVEVVTLDCLLVRSFVALRCRVDPNASVAENDLQAAQEQYFLAGGAQPFGPFTFSWCLKAEGFRLADGRWQGLEVSCER